jgi:hypothetical protein
MSASRLIKINTNPLRYGIVRVKLIQGMPR